MRTLRRIRRSVAALLRVWYLPSCYHFAAPQPLTPQEYIMSRQPKEARLTLDDGRRIVLRRPWVTADSIVGRERIGNAAEGYHDGDRFAAALTDVPRVEVRRLNLGLTIGLSVPGAGFLVASTVAYSNSSSPWGDRPMVVWR